VCVCVCVCVCVQYALVTWQCSFRFSVTLSRAQIMLKVQKLIYKFIKRIRKLLPVYRQSFFLFRCVNPAALPLVRGYSIRLPHGVASWVNYRSRQTESSSEHFASDLSLLKADAEWCEKAVLGFEPMTYGSESKFIDWLIDWLTALRHISTERLSVPRNVAK